MEKNDVQSGGQDPVPKQLFSSLIYSTGHLVHPLTTQLQHTQTQFTRTSGGKEDESLGQYDHTAFSHLCSVSLQHLTFTSGKKKKWSDLPLCGSRGMSQTLRSFNLGLWNCIIHNYLCMQRLQLIKGILLCLAGSLQKCKRVKSSFKKTPAGRKL